MSANSVQFYSRLPVSVSSMLEIRTESQFEVFPDDWFVLLTDVTGSTKAIQEGRYKDVNAMGAASITAVLNALDREDIPFVFGGDGATFVVHASKVEKAIFALNGVRNMARDMFKLDLRVGRVPAKELREQGFPVRVCKYQVTEGYTQALFFGGGLDLAESLIKKDKNGVYQVQPDEAAIPDTTGFECRWDHIPSERGETVALLVKSLAVGAQPRLDMYHMILQKVYSIYGLELQGNPVGLDQMKTTLSAKKLSVENRVRHYKTVEVASLKTLLDVWFKAFLGRIFAITGKTVWDFSWKEYRQVVRKNADYRKFDDMLRMLLTGSVQQREELRQELDVWREKGWLVYGTHESPETLITCMVLDRGNRHCHFVDGSQGGYALAAVELKSQLKTLSGS